jgi:hypothetical protein
MPVASPTTRPNAAGDSAGITPASLARAVRARLYARPVNSSEPLVVLAAFVEAHATPLPRGGGREPIMYFRHFGGTELQHHALAEVHDVDDALLEELHMQGYLDIDYREHNWNLTPTAACRQLVEQHQRILSLDPVADPQPVLDALAAQAESDNKLAWPAVRPVLAALRAYWEAGGFSPHGVQLPALLKVVPEEHEGLFIATVRALVGGDYLLATTDLIANEVPAEVAFSDRAHAVVDGWPGAAPDELVENLLAVVVAAASSEKDPTRKRRLEGLVESVRELGVATAGDLLARAFAGGLG